MALLLISILLALMYHGHSSSLFLIRALDALDGQPVESQDQTFFPKKVANRLVCANQLLGLAEGLLLLFMLAMGGPVNSLFSLFPIEIWQIYLFASLIAIPIAYLSGMGYLYRARRDLAPLSGSDTIALETRRMVSAINQAYFSHLALLVVGPVVAVAIFFLNLRIG